MPSSRWPGADSVAAILRETADSVVLPRHRALAEGEVREKTGPKDLVTVADIEAERRIAPRLRALLPGSVVVGEEAAAADPSLLRHLEAGDAPAWIVDPVDGTGNFANGKRYFCVMAALAAGGETVLGVILDPLGECWAAAEKGGGAWLHAYNGGAPERMRVAAPVPLSEMWGGFNARFLESPLREEVRARASAALHDRYSLGCAGHEHMRAARGVGHFTFHARTMPWDHAPGCLIHAEAGGVQARIDGTPYRPSGLSGGLLAATDRESWRALRNALFGEGAAPEPRAFARSDPRR